jgi:hypothetical protein
MSANVPTESGHSLSELMSGIVNDAHTLLNQQLTLFKQEMRQDFQQAREAAQFMGTAVALLAVGGFLLCFMLVYLLQELTHLPLWASFGIVGAALSVIGGGLVFLGREQMRSASPVAEKTTQALEENLEWKTKPR